MSDQQRDQEAIRYQEKIRSIACMESNMIAPNLFQYMGYRKFAAEQLLKAKPDSSTEKSLRDQVELMNQKIKHLLVL